MKWQVAGSAAVLAIIAGACSRGPTLDTRTFELQYIEGIMALRMLDPYVYGDRAEGAGSISIAGNLVTVRETGDNLDKIARVLAEYDRPKPSVRLHFQIIEADGASRVDPAIADVEGALRRLFRFEGYRLVAEAMAGGLEGSRIRQAIAGEGSEYAIEAYIQAVRAVGDSGVVKISVILTMEGGEELETTVAVPIGRTAVLGNAQSSTAGGTLILTVRPELVSS